VKRSFESFVRVRTKCEKHKMNEDVLAFEMNRGVGKYREDVLDGHVS
jgi:hypothetical protein